MCICIPNVKFLCLTLWQGEVCTGDDANTNHDANANEDDTQWTKHASIRLFG